MLWHNMLLCLIKPFVSYHGFSITLMTVLWCVLILHKNQSWLFSTTSGKLFPLTFVFICNCARSECHFANALIKAFVDGFMESQTYLTFSTKPVSPLALRNAGWVTAAWIWTYKECNHCSDTQIFIFCPEPPLHAPQTAVVWGLKAMTHYVSCIHTLTQPLFIGQY